MLRFSCPECQKALRAPEEKAGATVKCPGCGHRFSVPGDEEEESQAPEVEEREEEKEEEEEERPRKRKKKGSGSRKRQELAAKGKTLVIAIVALIVVLQIWSQISAFTSAPPPQQGPPGAGVDPNSASYKIGMVIGAGCVGVLHLVPIIFLLLKHNWARLALAVVLIGSALCTSPLIILALMVAKEGLPILGLIEAIVRIGANIGSSD